ncbi:MAG: AAA family ATPase [Desulfovibrio sp.]|jgi:DNA repair protein RecN (Recombination protein N)|nr:AAA family ATPase [Desulfovibrio sp.]
MLELLRIRDLALIEDLELEFSPGMNVLTGETGAGKSFILKALNFLTGEKIGADMVRPGRKKAAVEAVFVLENEECILRRELPADGGRGRVYLNDRLCSQETVRDLRPRLILHSAQHGQQKLLQASFQCALLDGFLRRPDLLSAKDGLCVKLARIGAEIRKLEADRLALEEKRDLLEYQRAEIDKVAPKPGEEEELETRRARLRNQAALAEESGRALAALHGEGDAPGVFRNLAQLERSLEVLSGMLEEFAPIPEQLAGARELLLDLEKRLRRLRRASGEGEDVEALEARLFALAQLKRKLRRPLDSILDLYAEIARNLDFLDHSALDRRQLEREEEETGAALAAVLDELNPLRQKAAAELSRALEAELRLLGFSEHIRVFFEFAPHELYAGKNGLQELVPRIFWSPNPGHPPQPLDRIASGGELSRFLLAVVSLASKNGAERPTLIFDEIDAGIGGLTLNRVGAALERLSSSRQMLLITHWPQLAAKAGRHFVVSKEVREGQTYALCRHLSPTQVPAELARMAGEEAQEKN